MGIPVKNIMLFTALGAPSACLGGGGSGIPDDHKGDKTVGQILNGDGTPANPGEALRARHVAGMLIDFDADTTRQDDWDDFTVRRNADGELTATVEGVEHAFTTAQRNADDDGTVYGYDFRDDSGANLDRFLYLWSGGDNALADLGDNNDDYFEVFYVGFSDDGGHLRGFAVVGNPTADFSSMAGTATYDGGFVQIDVYDAEGFEGTSTSRDRLRSEDVTLTADFSDSTISGRIHDFRFRGAGDDDYVALSGNDAILLKMLATKFTNRGFAGKFTVSGLDTFESADIGYDGSFFGPGAETVAGTISGTGQFGDTASDVGPANIIGWFAAAKPEE